MKIRESGLFYYVFKYIKKLDWNKKTFKKAIKYIVDNSVFYFDWNSTCFRLIKHHNELDTAILEWHCMQKIMSEIGEQAYSLSSSIFLIDLLNWLIRFLGLKEFESYFFINKTYAELDWQDFLRESYK